MPQEDRSFELDSVSTEKYPVNRKDLIQTLSRYSKPDSRKALYQIINTFIPYVGLWALMIYCVIQGFSVWITLFLSVMAAAFLVRLFVLVVHANHTNEINARVEAAFKLLKNKGITLLNQSVLLKAVNDNATELCHLSEKLFALGIIPYYLHLLDKASGTGHFEVPEQEAKQILKQVQDSLPGYLVPKLVKEIAGASAKQSVFAGLLNQQA